MFPDVFSPKIAGVLSLVAVCLAFTLLGPIDASAAPTIKRSDTGSVQKTSKLEDLLCNTNFVVELPAGESLPVFDIPLSAAENAAFHISVSSEAITVAVLSGRVSSGDAAAGVGEALSWPIDSATPRTVRFDVGRLMASSTPAIDSPLRMNLAPVVAAQESDMFWGLVEPVGINLQAPLSPAMESARRDILCSPALIRARREAQGDTVNLEKNIANAFLTSLSARDTRTVGDLLDPAMFAKEGRENDWQALRGRFAQRLTQGKLPARLRGYDLGPGAEHAWTVTGGKYRFILRMSGRDGGVPFVQSLEQQ